MQNTWPRISLVTPSFNQAQYLPATIESILAQNYPNLEYIIIDGGSKDGSREIIEKYSKYCRHWVSEPDLGQADAINKGLAISTGELFGWINSDDLLEPGALFHIAELSGSKSAIAGACVNFSNAGETTWTNQNLSPVSLLSQTANCVFQQPALWFPCDRVRKLGGMNARLQFTFDWHFTIRYLSIFPEVTYTDRTLARFRLHESSKTVGQAADFRVEHARALELLLEDIVCAEYRPALRPRLEFYRWVEALSAIERSQQARAGKIASVLGRCIRNPRDGFQRETARSIRRILAA